MAMSDDDAELACGSVSVSGGRAGLGLTKADRATTDQCLDRRVLAVLRRLLSTGVLQEMGGVIATGKEANVYAGVGADGEPVAIKVYKSAILVFKDRHRYVQGEHRMRGGTTRPGNNLNMVVQWAEKEIRNLIRLEKAGVPCPKPMMLRKNVLVMSLVGEGETPAPRLKDAGMSAGLAARVYRRLMAIMHAIYHDCRLVHADLSEYNVLLRDEEPYIIDVSQAVEHNHPMAYEFLRTDCKNVTNFFKKRGVDCVSARALFQFVTDGSLRDADLVQARIDALAKSDKSFEAEEDAVWEQTTMPRTLDELWDFDRETARKEIKESSALSDALKRMIVVDSDDEKEIKYEFGSGDDDEDSSSEEEKEWEQRPDRPSKEQVKSERKSAKAEVKQERREHRKLKIPKKVKKRAEKLAKRKK